SLQSPEHGALSVRPTDSSVNNQQSQSRLCRTLRRRVREQRIWYARRYESGYQRNSPRSRSSWRCENRSELRPPARASPMDCANASHAQCDQRWRVGDQQHGGWKFHGSVGTELIQSTDSLQLLSGGLCFARNKSRWSGVRAARYIDDLSTSEFRQHLVPCEQR